ncbi:MAG: NTP transferase domain-containing protein [Alphaproteobacteria bacterium]|nr:NTP transferase domain-containing protein [Alphaproteobacteria bacterium]
MIAAAPRIVAVIQARMGSSRFPGKVLHDVAGKPLLWHVVERLKRSRRISAIAIATSTAPRDDAIQTFAEKQGLTAIRGPEDNVLARFAMAAEAMDADVIVRVSADAPFIDAAFIDHLVDALIAQDGDYVLLEDGAVTAHEGVDPFSRRALDKLMMDAAGDPVAREHVTGYFKLHPDFVHIVRAAPYPPLAVECGRLTIDTPDDLAFIEAIHARLGVAPGAAALGDVVRLLGREPILRNLNAHVQQKPIARAAARVLIRCDGGGAYGYGHVKRMLSLARALRDREGFGVQFALNGTEDALATIRHGGFPAETIAWQDDARELAARLAENQSDVLVCDLREGLSRPELARLAQRVPVTVVVDDGSGRRLSATAAYYPPLPQVERLSWHGADTLRRVGWEWALLGLRKVVTAQRPAGGRPTVLVSMGGSDPFGLTWKAAEALAALDTVMRVRFVIGQGMADGARIARAIVALSPNFETIEGADDLATEYASADLALIAFGVTAYELAAAGVPALYLCLTPDHAQSASAFAAAGMGLSLGLAEAADGAEMVEHVRDLMADAPRRRAMRNAGMAAIDGKGAERIAADLAALLAQKRGQQTQIVSLARPLRERLRATAL